MSAVAVEGVWKFYGDYPALRDIRLSADAGACLALIGRNGAGKTTLLRIIAGFSRPGRGQILIQGAAARHGNAAPHRLHRPWHLGLRRAFRLENLTLFARLYQSARAARAALEWLERTGLERVRGRPGARIFARHAPAAGGGARVSARSLRAAARRAFHRARRPRHRRAADACCARRWPQGKTIVMSTHQLREALELASHVALLEPRQGGVSRPVHAGNGGRSRATSTRATARADGLLPRRCWWSTAKDLRAELRTKEAINASLAFALVILLLFSFAFDPDRPRPPAKSPAACCGSSSPSPARWC